ncbi:UDP-3-O-(3-hydroxymyristoyl)glucosamine N-acyltransferase, partial [Brevundimonas naejangsanensis]
MPDPRFFQTLSSLTVAALAEHIGGEVVRGGEVVISAVAPLSSADRGAISVVGGPHLAPPPAPPNAGWGMVAPAAG